MRLLPSSAKPKLEALASILAEISFIFDFMIGDKATVLHSGQDMSETRSLYERWLDSAVSPLVVSDTTLPSLSMVGADRGTVLIHWDLPSDSKKTFSLRFVFIKSGVRSM